MKRNSHWRAPRLWERRGRRVLIHGRWLVFLVALYWAFTRPPYYLQGSPTASSSEIPPVKYEIEIVKPGVVLMARPETAATAEVNDGLEASVISSGSELEWVWVKTLFSWGSALSGILSVIGLVILVIYRREAPEGTYFPISILVSTVLLHSTQLANLILLRYFFVFYDNNDWICKLLWFLRLFCACATILNVTAQGFYELFRDVHSDRKHMRIYALTVYGLSLCLSLAWVGYSERVSPDQCWQEPIKPAQIYSLLAPTSFLVALNVILNFSSVYDALEADGVKSVGITRVVRGLLVVLLMLPYTGAETILYALRWGFTKGDWIRNLYHLFNSVNGLVLLLRYCYLWEPIRRAIRRDFRRTFFRRAIRCQAKKRPEEEGGWQEELELRNTSSHTV